MMKKLLVLMIVLVTASIAHADLTAVTTWTDGICTWTLDLDDGKVYGTGTSVAGYLSPLIQQTSGTGRLDPTPSSSGPTYKDGTYNEAGDLGYFKDPYAGVSGYEGFYWQAEAGDGGSEVLPNQATGLWFEADVGLGDFVMKYWSGTAMETALQGTIIPEPATLALLALGGLLLRRRK
jgi:hypothetical protein